MILKWPRTLLLAFISLSSDKLKVYCARYLSHFRRLARPRASGISAGAGVVARTCCGGGRLVAGRRPWLFPGFVPIRQGDKAIRTERCVEGGVQLTLQPSEEADAVFGDPTCASAMWFTAGNHEDYDALKDRERGSGREADDSWSMLMASCAAFATAMLPPCREGCASAPFGESTIVLRGPATGFRPAPASAGAAQWPCALRTSTCFLPMESPRDAILVDQGSEEIGEVIRFGQPAFAFFGHYHPTGNRVEGDFGVTRVYHFSHLELRTRAEPGSVGALT